MSIRDIEPRDLEPLIALNNAYAAEVNALTIDGFMRALQVARTARVMEGLEGVEGAQAFVMAFDEKTPPQGPNHAWFLARRPAFLYVDRLVVAAQAQRRGLARQLYQDLVRIADGCPLCCEVNIDPLNSVSLAFHAKLGFVACGEATDPRNRKKVRYLVREAA
jgi:predicted GNAT superfamily acetyltransferase